MQLFINHRLVDSSSLKRALEMVYSAYLPKGSDLSSHDFSRSASTILSVSPWVCSLNCISSLNIC